MREQFLDRRGVRLQLLEGGEGAPLLYLHGAGGAGQWGAFHDGLARHFRVLAPTHPGFGVSADLPDLSAVDDFALFYLDLLDSLGLESLPVIGHSLGGWIAAELAVWQPQRVSKLVLASAAGLRREGVVQPDIFAQSSTRGGETSPEALEQALRDRATLARVAWNPYLHNPRLPGRLYRLTMPTMLVWGQNDPLIPPSIGERWAELIPQARLELIPNATHPIHREQPDAVLRAVLPFLAPEAAE